MENLGDGALFTSNFVFRVIRQTALSIGCEFTLDDEFGYFAWPIVSLNKILESRRIPYRRTASAFHLLENSRPKFFTTEHTELAEPYVNVLLHEAAHCVADHTWHSILPPLKLQSSSQRIVMRFALSEAFANTCELLAMLHTKKAVDQWLLAFNSYWAHIPQFASAFSTIMVESGGVSAAKWLLLCFLSANLCRTSLEASTKQKLLTLCEIRPEISKKPRVASALNFLANEALSLNIDFRLHAASMFYASVGLNPNVRELMNFDFASALFKDEYARHVLHSLCQLIIERESFGNN